MNNKQYHLIIDLINTILRFMVAYSIISIIILFANVDPTFVVRALFLFPAPILSHFLGKYTKHIWSFLLLQLIMLAAYTLTTGNIIVSIIYGLYLTIIIMTEFQQKLKTENPPKTNTSLLLLTAFLVMSLYCNYLELTNLKELFFVIVIVYILLHLLNMYLINFQSFFQHNDNMTNVPIQQIRNTNNTLILFFGSFCIFVMLIFAKLPLGGLLSSVGSLFLYLLRAFFSIFNGGNQDETPPVVEPKDSVNASDSFPLGDQSEPSFLIELIQKIAIGLIALALIAGIIAFIVYSLYKLYQLFYQKKSNNFRDKTEFISPFEKREYLKKEKQNSYKINFRSLFGRTNNELIRKHFYKAVTSHMDSSELLSANLTPSQLSKYAFAKGRGLPATPSDPEKMKQLTTHYEKARYSNEECSKADILSVKNILK